MWSSLSPFSKRRTCSCITLRTASVGLTLGGCGTTSCIPSILGTASGVWENDDVEPYGGNVVVAALVLSELDASDGVCEGAGFCATAASRARCEASVSMSPNLFSLA